MPQKRLVLHKKQLISVYYTRQVIDTQAFILTPNNWRISVKTITFFGNGHPDTLTITYRLMRINIILMFYNYLYLSKFLKI